jgi:hypothetical protein
MDYAERLFADLLLWARVYKYDYWCAKMKDDGKV